MSDVRNMIVQDEYTYASFLSPGGRGYKTLVRVADNIDNTSYNEYLEALKNIMILCFGMITVRVYAVPVILAVPPIFI